VLLEEAAEKSGRVFAEGAIFGTEGGEEVGVDIEFADNLVVNEDGDNNFGFGFKGAGEIAGIGIDVMDNDGLTRGGGGAADALVKRNAGMGSHGALERTKNENVVVPFFFQQIEANPIVSCDLLVEERNDALHESVGRGARDSEGFKSRDEVRRFGLRCGHGE